MQRQSKLTILFAIGAILIAARLYRRWSRLRHIKGPFLASFSELWILRTTFRGDMWRKFGTVCNDYGPVARVGPNEVVTADLDAIRRMWGVRTTYTRSNWYTVFRIDPARDQVSTQRNDKLHGEIRAKMRAGYSGKENLLLEGTIDIHVQHLVELIRTRYTSTSTRFRRLDFARVAQFFTLDVITDLAFGRAFGFIAKDEDVHNWVATLLAIFPAMNFLSVFPCLHLLLRPKFMQKYILPAEENRKGFEKMKEVINSVVEERYTSKIEKEDMLGSFIGHGVTKEEAPVEVFLQVVAGSDTTATAFRMTFLHLITSLNSYSKLRSEIQAAVREKRISSPIQDTESHKLPYLQACIKEGLRIWTPVPMAMFKLAPPSGDTIAGIQIPGGTKVGINWWGISRNKEVYGEDVDVYRPERWLEASSEKLDVMEKTNSLIFSPGRWECLGKTIALLELNKVFVEIFRNFDFQIVNPVRPLKTFNAGLHMQSEMWVRVTECNDLIE